MEGYVNPLTTRYASDEMIKIFSSLNKYTIWHDLWIALAEAEKELGLNISDEQINEMKQNKGKIDFNKIAEYEKETRHEVMAHIKGWGDFCPKARPIIHLGATSAYVMDNGDLIQMYQALEIIKKRLINLLSIMKKRALEYKSLPVLGYTHFQPAQLTTLGKRIALWIQDIVMDINEIEFRLNNKKLRGAKGTVGTQDSFMKLFDNDSKKVKKLDYLVCKKLGFEPIELSSQTYTRKIDYQLLSTLSGIAQSLHKIGTDIRLLQGLGEIEEPFEEKQVGSSAMPYKRNPMRSERICSLTRYVMTISPLAGQNYSLQWLERTLDDSANRRIMISEAFLALDAAILIAINVFKGLIVNKKIIEKRIKDNLPFLSAEYVITESVKKGYDRQEIHELFRETSMEALKKIKNGENIDLIKMLTESKKIPLKSKDIEEILTPEKMTGRAEEQVLEYLDFVDKILNRNKILIENLNFDLKV
ncbi:MAG TPA: adenylosuccinate lyase [Spirochaetota bacterium]|nr:adenylosuccinate lyase [Spirochaetota bacterium]HOM38298.1 adenylosuccinate lyase [Spirochaetota bacterium]HPQ48484.1 adenylosuccinate lyase [Spirochaetota bacterium]